MKNTFSEKEVWALLEQVFDPEIPVLSVVDLGVVRAIELLDDGGVEVVITPTYSGCPAMMTIELGIIAELEANGLSPVKVRTVLQPAWTTDWISAEGRKKLLAYGIAPPVESTTNKRVLALFEESPVVPCPQCSSENTKLLSEFGSTACKSMYQCQDCKEPFDYFKCH